MPKQLLKIMGDHSSFQESLLRVQGFRQIAPPLVIANEMHRFLLAQQAMETGTALSALLTEPVARDTAVAVAIAAIWLSKRQREIGRAHV